MANEFVVKNGLIVSGSTRVQGSVTATSFTGSFSGSISNAVTASYALTASSVTTLNQTVLITASLGVGVGSLGSTENTLVVGPAPAGGSGEGGQILLQAVGGTYTSASMLDTYQNRFRVLRGTNASSDGSKLQLDLQTGQLQLPNYTSTSAFTGTTLIGFLGFDSNGNILTSQTSSTALSGGSANYIARWASSIALTTGSIYDTGTNVGIGTTNPSTLLHLSSTAPQLAFTATGLSRTSYIGMGDGANFYIKNTTAGNLYISDYNEVYIAYGGSSGNVGIGTSSVGAKLEINSNAALPIIRARYNGTYYTDYDSNGIDFRGSGQTFDIKDNGTVAIRVASGGNVGIGTTNPNEKLHVAGNIHAYAAGGINAGLFASTAAGSTTIAIRSNGITHFNGGNVGIGTTNPGYRLAIQNSGASDSIITEYRMTNGNNAATFRTDDNVIFGIHAQNSGDIYIKDTSDNVLFYGKNGGSVGIGTTSPATKFNVAGGRTYLETGNEIYTLGISRSGANAYYLGVSNSSSPDLYISNNAGTTRVTITDGGNVGIGTTNPIYKLHVVGSTYVNNGTLYLDSGQWAFWGNSAQGIRGINDTSLDFLAGNAVRMIVLADGNVGIGTTGPVAKLTVLAASTGYSSDSQIKISDTTTSYYGGLSFDDAGSTRLSIRNSYDGTGSTIGFGFGSSADKVQIIDGTGLIVNEGNVGIGTTNPQAKLQVSGSTNVLNVRGSGSATTSSIFSVDGNNGRLFEVSDDLSNSLFSVNTIAGLPVIEAFADYSVTMGTYGQYVLQVTGSNVGIGSSAPGAKLDVNGNVRAISFTGSISGSATNAVSASYALTASYALNAGDSIWTGSAGNIYYNGGNVGIGITNPSQKLVVIGNTAISGVTYTDFVQTYSGASIDFRHQDASVVMRVDTTNARVGIGSTAPSAKLEVATQTGTSTVLLGRATGNSSIKALTDNGGYLALDSTGGELILNHYSSANMWLVTGGGNVGINTTSPSYKLDVNGTGRFTSTLIAESNIDLSGDLRYQSNAGFGIKSLNGTRILEVYNTGINFPVGITGTSAVFSSTVTVGSPFTIKANNPYIQWQDAAGTRLGYIQHATNLVMSADTGAISLTTTSGQLWIASGGNVGIGTTNPAYKLDVIGSARIGQSSNSSTNAQLELTAGGSSYNAAIDFGYYNTFDASIWKAGMFGDDGNKFKIQFTGGGPAYDVFTITGTSTFAFLTGSMGIGTTSPGNKLTVYSDTTADGILVDVLSRPRITLRDRGNSDTIIGTGDYGLDDFFIDTYSGNAFAIKGSTRNIGIGTTNPAYNLHTYGSNPRNLIHDSGTGYPIVQLLNDSGNLYMAIDNSTGSGFGSAYGRYLYSNGAYPLIFVVNSNEVIRITSGGNVGIGTATPVRKLHVYGDAQVDTNLVVSSGIYNVNYYAGGATATYFKNSAGADTMAILESGFVGIGTTTPTAKLEVIGNVKATSFTGSFSGSITHAVSASYALTASYALNAGDSIWTGSAGNIYYSGGNVGIGTASPAYKLDVFGTDDTTPEIRIGNGSGKTAFIGFSNTYDFDINAGGVGGNYLNLKGGANGSTGGITFSTFALERMRIDYTGKVGIGITDPSAKLDVYRGLQTDTISRANSAAYIWGADIGLAIGQYASGPYGTWIQSLKYDTNASFPLSLNPSGGNVGIGTASPTAKLHVVGSTYTVGTIGIQGTNVFYFDDYGGGWYMQDSTWIRTYNSKSVWTGVGYLGTDGGLTAGYGGTTPPSGGAIIAGSVGIGVSSPAAKLHINGGDVWVNTVSAIQGMQFGYSGPSHGSYRAAVMGGPESYGGTDSGMLTFHTQNGYVVSSTPPERMRISSGGNVGIGTTSPSTVLNIASTAPVVRLNPGTNNSTAIEFGVLNAATNAYARIDATNEVNFDTNLRFYTNAVSSTTQVERMRISSEGNIGIGTTSPAYKLEVSGGDAVIRNAFIGLIPSYGSNYASFSHTSRSAVNKYSFLSGNAGDTYINASNGYSIFFRQENIDQMVITGGGNVGIGTTSPAYRLDVNVASNSDALRIQQSGAPRFILNGDGVMTWGGGSANAGFLSWDTSLAIVGGQSGTALALYAAGSEKVRITTNGNVGIGNTNPLTKLFVAGTIRANGTDGQADVDPTSGAFRFYDGSTFRGGFGTDAWATSGNASNLTTYLNGGNYYIYSTTTGTKIFTALADGNIGIGTTTPAAKLDIVGDAVIRNGYNMVIGDTIANPVASTSKAALTLRKFTSGNASTVVSASYYLGVGGNEYTIGSYRLIGFGYAETSGTTTYPAYIGYRETSTSGYTLGDLIFGTRATTGASDDPSERMRITSGGNVGIGSTSPTAKLDIVGTSSTFGISFGNTVPNNPLFINTYGGWSGIGMDQTTAGLRLVGDYSSGASPLVDIGYYSSATVGHATWVNRFRVLNNGNVGIGTTSPSHKLQVVGPGTFASSTTSIDGNVGLYMTIGGSASNYNGILFQGVSVADMYLGRAAGAGVDDLIIFGGGELVRFKQNGNVGIGTSAPAAKLEVNGNIKLSSTAGSTSTPSNIWLGNDFSNGSTRDKLKVYLYNSGIEQYGFTVGSSGDVQYHSNSYHDFYIANTLSLRINSSGNVGIGTTSPSQKLHTYGTNPRVFIQDSSTGYPILQLSNNSNGSFYFAIDNSAGSGFGSAYGRFLYSEGAYPMVFVTNSAEAMRITSSGYVGIGTGSPVEKLQVAGNIRLGVGGSNDQLAIMHGSGVSDYGAVRFYSAGANTQTIHSFSAAWQGGNIFNASTRAINIDGDAGVTFGSWPTPDVVFVDGGISYFRNNVGIGTTTPAFALDAIGVVRATTFIETSAKKYKTNIQNLEPQLNKVLQLQPVTFDWKEKKGERPSIGLIADDVINIYPEFVVKNKENEIEGIDYSKLTAVLIQSVKELKEIIDRQQEQINALLTK